MNNVDLKIDVGEIVGLLGPNGAGKTTIFYMLAGLIRSDGGNTYLDGAEISQLPMHQRAKRGIGYLPQESSIFRKMTVKENIKSIVEILDISRHEKKERLDELLSEFSVKHIEARKGYLLSGGERRRVEIARALVTQPLFLLLDEPFTGIDPIVVSDIQKIITHLKEKGIGVLISDHNVRETLSICDRAYIINEGEILEEGAPEAISRSEKVRRFYLGENFKLLS